MASRQDTLRGHAERADGRVPQKHRRTCAARRAHGRIRRAPRLRPDEGNCLDRRSQRQVGPIGVGKVTVPSANFLRRFAEVSARVASMAPSAQKSELKAQLAALRKSVEPRADKQPKPKKASPK